MNADVPVVFVVDDDVSIREAVTNLLRSVGLKVETFETAQQFLTTQPSSAPGCILLDIRLPGISGLDLQRQLAKTDVRLPIIFITGHGDIPMSVQAIKAGAIDFLTKPFRDQDLLDAVHLAIENSRETRHQRLESETLKQLYGTLTAREQEVFALVVQGFVNKEIGAKLNISEATVKLHRGRLMQKMEADSFAELMRRAEKLRIQIGSRPK